MGQDSREAKKITEPICSQSDICNKQCNNREKKKRRVNSYQKRIGKNQERE